MHEHRYAMIMAGGSGTRLWPMSRVQRPKQLLPLLDGRSLLELAADRISGAVPDDHRLICTSESYRAAVRTTLPAFGDEQILGEPVGRDTVNAVGLTAAILLARDPEAIFAVVTSDHLLQPVDEFRRKLEVGFRLVEMQPKRFVTFGITPTHPAVGYGYVERGEPIEGYYDAAFQAKQFHEKPKQPRAQAFLEAGTFDWNSGMFVFPARHFLDVLTRFHPKTAAGLTRIAEGWTTPARRELLESIYPTLERISVDYAVMEPAAEDPNTEICTVRLDLEWIDVGSWSSYAETLQADGAGNRAHGRAQHIESENVVTVCEDPDHLITTIGCHDLIVVHTGDSTLVCRMDQDQKVKELAGEVDPDRR